MTILIFGVNRAKRTHSVIQKWHHSQKHCRHSGFRWMNDRMSSSLNTRVCWHMSISSSKVFYTHYINHTSAQVGVNIFSAYFYKRILGCVKESLTCSREPATKLAHDRHLGRKSCSCKAINCLSAFLWRCLRPDGELLNQKGQLLLHHR